MNKVCTTLNSGLSSRTIPGKSAGRSADDFAITTSNRAQGAGPVCRVDGCDKEVHIQKHGLCQRCYDRERSKGALNLRTWAPRPDECVVGGCRSAVEARGYCNKHYVRWQKHGDANYVRPPVAPRSARLPENISSPAELARIMGFSRQRAHQLLTKDKHNARVTVANAIKQGIIAKPPFCFRCGLRQDDLEAHHWDYDRPLDVGWFCPKCHSAVHPHARRTKRAS